MEPTTSPVNSATTMLAASTEDAKDTAAVAALFHQQDEEDDDNAGPAIQRLQRECAAMMQLLQRLQAQQEVLQIQNTILAREALLNGLDVTQLEPLVAKRRGKAVTGNSNASTVATGSTTTKISLKAKHRNAAQSNFEPANENAKDE